MVSPVSRKSMRVCTGTRVCAKQGVPCMTSLSMVTTPASAFFCSAVIADSMIGDLPPWGKSENCRTRVSLNVTSDSTAERARTGELIPMRDEPEQGKLQVNAIQHEEPGSAQFERSDKPPPQGGGSGNGL